jgi:hypothetical protein
MPCASNRIVRGKRIRFRAPRSSEAIWPLCILQCWTTSPPQATFEEDCLHPKSGFGASYVKMVRIAWTPRLVRDVD